MTARSENQASQFKFIIARRGALYAMDFLWGKDVVVETRFAVSFVGAGVSLKFNLYRCFASE
jgi:hypothetical protein